MNIKNETFVFTGSLITMSRKQAQALVFSLGGKIQKSISKSTTVLVIEATQKRNEKKHFITIINKKKLMKKSFYH